MPQPVDVRFGCGVAQELASRLSGRPYVLLTYPRPHLAECADALIAAADVPLLMLGDLEANPTIEALERQDVRLRAVLGGRFERETAPVFVALGGGSVIDSAKVLAALATEPRGTLRDLLARPAGTEPAPAAPVIAVPSTAGTGSEVTPWATVWDPAEGRKWSLARDDLYPQAAYVDPQLTLSAPRALTLQTGLDALAHALESIWNVNATPQSRVLAIDAARTILRTLPDLLDALDDLDLRSAQAQGALLAGLAFAQTRTALAHELSYPLTLRHGVPHGIACAVHLPEVMAEAVGCDADCDRALAAVFGCAPALGVERLRAFVHALSVSTSVTDYGVTAEQWAAVGASARTGTRGRNFIASSPRAARP